MFAPNCVREQKAEGLVHLPTLWHRRSQFRSRLNLHNLAFLLVSFQVSLARATFSFLLTVSTTSRLVTIRLEFDIMFISAFSPVVEGNHAGVLWIVTILGIAYSTVAGLIRACIKYKAYGVDDLLVGIATVSMKLRAPEV